MEKARLCSRCSSSSSGSSCSSSSSMPGGGKRAAGCESVEIVGGIVGEAGVGMFRLVRGVVMCGGEG